MRDRRSLRSYEEHYLGSVHAALSENGGEVQSNAEDAVRYGRNLLENDYPPLYDRAHVARVCGVAESMIAAAVNDPSAHYQPFRLRKRRGGSRLIMAPTGELKTVQRWIQRHITRHLPVHEAAHGFRGGHSTITNAQPHVGSPLVLRMDLVDFFGAVPKSTVFRTFRRAGYTQRVAETLARLTTFNGSLPQGAPTSPDLANAVAYRLDARLSGLADRAGFSYTRYADDLTFSGQGVEVPKTRRAIEHIIRDCGFAPNERKTNFRTQGERQLVTGVVVNTTVSWPRARRRWIRQEVHHLVCHGVAQHVGRRGYTQARYRDFIYGHVYALYQLHPGEAIRHLEDLGTVDWEG